MKRKIAILIILIIIMIRVFFPRVKYGYRELETIKIYYYNNGNHQIVINDDKSKKEIYDRIRYSWLTSLDLFYVGDDNGSDGVAIQLLYMNGDSEFFDSCEHGSGFTKYIYSSKSRTVKGQMQINSSKLEKTIDKYIEKGSFETVETVTINGAEENTYDSESSNETSSNVNDLIYYGKSSIQADKGSNIIIRVVGLDDYDSIKSINVYNCQTKQEVQLPVSSEVKYTAEDDASYYIYAINNKGESLDLSNSISIEHAYTTDDEFIMD